MTPTSQESAPSARLLTSSRFDLVIPDLAALGFSSEELARIPREGPGLVVQIDRLAPEPAEALLRAARELGATACVASAPKRQRAVVLAAPPSVLAELAGPPHAGPVPLAEVAAALHRLLERSARTLPPFGNQIGAPFSEGRTLVMSILNLTPDSFSGDGIADNLEQAVARGVQMAEDGADVIDVGGESTRPWAEPIDTAEELRRTIPIIAALARRVRCPISIDTSKAAVARAALDAGASIVNDVTALTADGELAQLVAEREVPVVLMHMQGTPRTMQQNPVYRDLMGEIIDFLDGRIEAALASGIRREQILVDPGIGFGKSLAHNLTILRRLGELRSLGQPILIGTSRKGFLGQLLGVPPPEREMGTAATVALAIAGGASVVRVHDVGPMVQAARVADAVLGRWAPPAPSR